MLISITCQFLLMKISIRKLVRQLQTHRRTQKIFLSKRDRCFIDLFNMCTVVPCNTHQYNDYNGTFSPIAKYEAGFACIGSGRCLLFSAHINSICIDTLATAYL